MKNAKRIFAWIGIILLVAMYASTMVFALMKSPAAAGLLKASVYCTIVVPVIIYSGTLIFKNSHSGKELPPDEDETPESDTAKDTAGKTSARKK